MRSSSSRPGVFCRGAPLMGNAWFRRRGGGQQVKGYYRSDAAFGGPLLQLERFDVENINGGWGRRRSVSTLHLLAPSSPARPITQARDGLAAGYIRLTTTTNRQLGWLV